MSQELYKKAAEKIIGSGFIPMEISENVLALMELLLTEEQAVFVKKYEKPMLMTELLSLYGEEESKIERLLDELMTTGVMMGTPTKNGNIYRLMPILPGIFEYTMMRGKKGEKEKKLAHLYEGIFSEFTDLVQDNYDSFMPVFETIPPITRVVPINKTIEEDAVDNVYPLEDVMGIVDKFDTIAIAHCYCRTEKDLLDKPCSTTNERENCLLFGKTAQFAIDYKFGRKIPSETAKDILLKASEEGLVHKSFHKDQDLEKDEFAICNCCKCCCQTFGMYYRGMAPSHNYSSRLAFVNADDCVACEECIEVCPLEMITLKSDGEAAQIDEKGCIGCGVCAVKCPAEAITLKKTERRAVFTAPKKVM